MASFRFTPRKDKHKIQSLCSLWIFCVKNLCNQPNPRETFKFTKIINSFRFLRNDKHKIQSLCSLWKNSVLTVLKNQRNPWETIAYFRFLRNDKHKMQSLCSLWILCALCVKNLCNLRNQREIFNFIKIINSFRFLRNDKHKMQSMCSLWILCALCVKKDIQLFLTFENLEIKSFVSFAV